MQQTNMLYSYPINTIAIYSDVMVTRQYKRPTWIGYPNRARGLPMPTPTVQYAYQRAHLWLPDATCTKLATGIMDTHTSETRQAGTTACASRVLTPHQ